MLREQTVFPAQLVQQELQDFKVHKVLRAQRQQELLVLKEQTVFRAQLVHRVLRVRKVHKVLRVQ